MPPLHAAAVPRLILASASPRRQSLLREAGYTLEIDPAHIDEETYPRHLAPPQIAEYLATAKAQAVAARHPDDVTLGADTVVSLGDLLLGKPLDAADARRMLSLLSGTTHHVATGVALLCPSMQFHHTAVVTSTVRMRLLSASEIGAYVATDQWQGKAGGYGIQDEDPFVTHMAGSLTNIVGLPMETVTELLSAAGIFPGIGYRV
jgi:septum formation protein